MFAFVSAAAPLASTAFSGAALCGARAPSNASISMDMSKSVPFLEKPARLEGMVGNAEFDPLLLSNYVSPAFLREAELKHGRICMLAVSEGRSFGRETFASIPGLGTLEN